MIIIPQRRVYAIDLLDEAIAALRTIHCAMSEPAELDDEALHAMANVLWGAMRQLQPVREEVNRLHGAA
jgi:hypothetical protein